MCDFLKGAHKEWIEEQEIPYAYKDDEWVSYDNLRSFEKKVCIFLEHLLHVPDISCIMDCTCAVYMVSF